MEKQQDQKKVNPGSAEDKSELKQGWRRRIHEVIFEAETPAGKGFDVILLCVILLSILAVMLESVREIEETFGFWLKLAEWGITILFTLEYLARIISVSKPHRYILSFYGIIDLLALLPTYLTLVITGGQYLVVIRAIRLLRVFRILKLSRYLSEGEIIGKALFASRYKITVFLGSALSTVLIFGTLMYLIESPESGFTSIPRSMYWAIVTLTTVGYGDIAPQTILGQFMASVIMLIGYAIIAVPTGIVTVELNKAQRAARESSYTTKACVGCSREGHDADAVFCKYCGTIIN